MHDLLEIQPIIESSGRVVKKFLGKTRHLTYPGRTVAGVKNTGTVFLACHRMHLKKAFEPRGVLIRFYRIRSVLINVEIQRRWTHGDPCFRAAHTSI